jgi:hypothetical protein
MLGRRFLLLVAVLMGLTALAASIAPREPLVRNGDQREQTPTPTPTPSPTSSTVQTVDKKLSISDEPKRVVVRQGELVNLEVSGPEVDSVELLDEVAPIDPQSPAIFELLADRPGSYPIMLVDANRRVGTLEVRASG